MSDLSPSEIQQKRFEKELKLISQLLGVQTYPRQTPFGVIVRIVYQAGVIHSSEVIFDLYLEGKYPFQPPKLVCESVFSFPSVSDGRDLVNEILKKKWTPSITSADLISTLPNFFILNLLRNQPEISVKDYGKFHLGSPYYLESWERKDSMASFYCTEIDLKSKKAVKERMIVLTHTVILVLELNNTYPGIGYLISWATLQALNCIRRSIKDSEVLTFEWKQIGDSPSHKQVFRIKDPNSFIELLSKNMQKLGAVVKRHSAKKLFKEDEVNGEEIKKMNIEEILQAIEVYEDNFETIMNQSIINTLLELYQRAIEYFAAFNSNQYNIFLKRMHLILSNENVINVLQGKTNVEEKKREFIVKSHKIEEINLKNESKDKPHREGNNSEEKKVEKFENFEKVELDDNKRKKNNDEKIDKNDEKIEKTYEKVEKNDENVEKNDEKVEKNDEKVEKNGDDQKEIFKAEAYDSESSKSDKSNQNIPELKAQDDGDYNELQGINQASPQNENIINPDHLQKNLDLIEVDQKLRSDQVSNPEANKVALQGAPSNLFNSDSSSSDLDLPKVLKNPRVEDELI